MELISQGIYKIRLSDPERITAIPDFSNAIPLFPQISPVYSDSERLHVGVTTGHN